MWLQLFEDDKGGFTVIIANLMFDNAIIHSFATEQRLKN